MGVILQAGEVPCACTAQSIPTAPLSFESFV